MVRYVLLAAFAAAGCLSPSVTECENGLVCAGDRVCDEQHGLCVVPDQLTVCGDAADGSTCTFGSTEGACRDGVCLVPYCGDGVLTGGEECDVGMMEKTKCNQLEEFYEDVDLKCSGCLYDRPACRAAGAGFCGDMQLDVTHGEYCDGSLPANNDSCVTFGYDAGQLGCNSDICAPGFKACASLRWSPASPDAVPSKIWGSGPTNVYAVGNAGLLARFDGSSWQQVQQVPGNGSNVTLASVHGTGPSDVYVVGSDNAGGRIFHFDGVAWTQMSLPANTSGLEDVWVSGTTGFAVGRGGTLLRLTGGVWSAMTSPTSEDLKAVWGTSATNVFAGGNSLSLTSGLFRFDGGTWSLQTLPEVSSIDAITSTPTGDVFVAGRNGGGHGRAATRVGTSWQAVPVPECTGPFTDLWARSATDIYATALPHAFVRSRTMFHYNGSSWTPIASPSAFSNLSIWGAAADDLWLGSAVGVFHGEGHFFAALPVEGDSVCSADKDSCADDPLTAIAGRSDNDVYAFGEANNCHYDGQNWTAVVPPADMGYASAWVSPTGVAFAVGRSPQIVDNCAVSRFKTDAMVTWGTAAAGFQEYVLSSTRDTVLHDVWGISATEVYAVGTQQTSACTTDLSPLFLRCNGSTCTELAATGTGMTRLRRVWGKSANEIYAMGDGSKLARWNGSTWSPLDPFPAFCPAVMDMTGVGTDLYATCLGGELRRYSTTSNTWELNGSTHLARFGAQLRVLPFTENDVFVFGADATSGTLTHYKDKVATPMRYLDGPINDAWGTADRLFWVGNEGVQSLVRTVPW